MSPLPRRSPPARHTDAASDYVELRSRSAFSFLHGASNPEDLVTRAAELELPVMALADRDGVSGLPRFHQAARRAGIRAIAGARVTTAPLDPQRDGGAPASRALASPAASSASPPEPSLELELEADTSAAAVAPDRDPPLLLLVESPRGWRSLSRLLSLAQQARPKGESLATWDQIETHSEGLTALLRGDESLREDELDRARAIFPGDRLWVDVSRHLERSAELAARRAADLATARGVDIVASNDVRCARAEDRRLLDALTCLLHKTTLDRAGRRLLKNGERHLRSRAEMAARFADRPEWIRATRAVAERCAFTLDDIDYRFPEYPVRPGETQAQGLRRLTWEGARQRYGHPVPPRARKQLEHELAVIEKLDLPGYFLIVHDISRFARDERILAQGRGSAANSAVCYALGVTAVDPVGMELLFERFLSEERGEWPDIDLDLPSGKQREKVIQYVFAKYGERGAAMTANVITYRTRSAVREMGKVLGHSPDAIDKLAKLLSAIEYADEMDELGTTLEQAGVDAQAPRVQQLLDLVDRVRGLPRHLGQHSGGIVIAAGALDEVVPIEPASMQDRHIVQWDKEDCADLGIIKIDLLGLGMLAALEETIPLIREHEGVEIDLAHLPPDDPDTYEMICRADTIGTFQIESRAQMATLPRVKPRCFYDLVVEIAIIRPGPIVGKMVHPYMDRRAGREPITYPHPSLEPILKRTLGVPIFQEQLLRLAMTAAGFSGGEAEELRRAMGFKRSTERMHQIEARLRAGMQERGLSPKAQEDITRYITSFALYGFPESHSASFALIAYASSYLKRHHPAAFLTGLLNAQPMGFYSPATLVKDAQRHGVEVRPIDVTRSGWRCTMEGAQCVRIGLRYAHGMREESALRLARERGRAAFAGTADLAKRAALSTLELDTLAELGALVSLPRAPQRRRAALWQVSALERDPTSLFAGQDPPDAHEDEASPLSEMSPLETTLSDYRLASLTTGPQLMSHLRSELDQRGILTAAALRKRPNGQWVRTAGHVIVRQRPGSAGGFIFLTLEDETGTSNAILTPQMMRRFRVPLGGSGVVEIAGPLQSHEGVIHVMVRELAPVRARRGLPGGREFR